MPMLAPPATETAGPPPEISKVAVPTASSMGMFTSGETAVSVVSVVASATAAATLVRATSAGIGVMGSDPEGMISMGVETLPLVAKGVASLGNDEVVEGVGVVSVVVTVMVAVVEAMVVVVVVAVMVAVVEVMVMVVVVVVDAAVVVAVVVAEEVEVGIVAVDVDGIVVVVVAERAVDVAVAVVVSTQGDVGGVLAETHRSFSKEQQPMARHASSVATPCVSHASCAPTFWAHASRNGAAGAAGAAASSAKKLPPAFHSTSNVGKVTVLQSKPMAALLVQPIASPVYGCRSSGL